MHHSSLPLHTKDKADLVKRMRERLRPYQFADPRMCSFEAFPTPLLDVLHKCLNQIVSGGRVHFGDGDRIIEMDMTKLVGAMSKITSVIDASRLLPNPDTPILRYAIGQTNAIDGIYDPDSIQWWPYKSTAPFGLSDLPLQNVDLMSYESMEEDELDQTLEMDPSLTLDDQETSTSGKRAAEDDDTRPIKMLRPMPPESRICQEEYTVCAKPVHTVACIDFGSYTVKQVCATIDSDGNMYIIHVPSTAVSYLPGAPTSDMYFLPGMVDEETGRFLDSISNVSPMSFLRADVPPEHSVFRGINRHRHVFSRKRPADTLSSVLLRQPKELSMSGSALDPLDATRAFYPADWVCDTSEDLEKVTELCSDVMIDDAEGFYDLTDRVRISAYVVLAMHFVMRLQNLPNDVPVLLIALVPNCMSESEKTCLRYILRAAVWDLGIRDIVLVTEGYAEVYAYHMQTGTIAEGPCVGILAGGLTGDTVIAQYINDTLRVLAQSTFTLQSGSSKKLNTDLSKLIMSHMPQEVISQHLEALVQRGVAGTFDEARQHLLRVMMEFADGVKKAIEAENRHAIARNDLSRLYPIDDIVDNMLLVRVKLPLSEYVSLFKACISRSITNACDTLRLYCRENGKTEKERYNVVMSGGVFHDVGAQVGHAMLTDAISRDAELRERVDVSRTVSTRTLFAGGAVGAGGIGGALLEAKGGVTIQNVYYRRNDDSLSVMRLPRIHDDDRLMEQSQYWSFRLIGNTALPCELTLGKPTTIDIPSCGSVVSFVLQALKRGHDMAFMEPDLDENRHTGFVYARVERSDGVIAAHDMLLQLGPYDDTVARLRLQVDTNVLSQEFVITALLPDGSTEELRRPIELTASWPPTLMFGRLTLKLASTIRATGRDLPPDIAQTYRDWVRSLDEDMCNGALTSIPHSVLDAWTTLLFFILTTNSPAQLSRLWKLTQPGFTGPLQRMPYTKEINPNTMDDMEREMQQ